MKHSKTIKKGLFLLLLASLPAVNAQFLGGRRVGIDEAGPKGQIMVYGGMDYSKTKVGNGESSFFGTFSDAIVPLGVGYFFNNNDLIGLNYAFSNNRTDTETYKQSETGIWYSPSVTLGKYFILIAQFDAHYVWGSNTANQLGAPSSEKYTGYRLRAYPLIGVLLGGGWALKFKFAELSTLQTKTHSGVKSQNHTAGFNASTFGVGISKNFSFAIKHKES